MPIENLEINIDPEGNITRGGDDKALGTVNLDTGEVKFANAAYAKGDYKAAIEERAAEFIAAPPAEAVEEVVEVEEGTGTDPRVPGTEPARDPELGSFSPAWINYDHANASKKEFAAKYKRSAECQLEFIALCPQLFADREALEARFNDLLKS